VIVVFRRDACGMTNVMQIMHVTIHPGFPAHLAEPNHAINATTISFEQTAHMENSASSSDRYFHFWMHKLRVELFIVSRLKTSKMARKTKGFI
jgi:hypothetical protein